MGIKKVQVDRGRMKRVLGIADLFAIGYGDLGSSIYYALGITTMYALGAAPLALLFAGLVFICTALTYAEMSSIMHEAGGSASFSRKTFNDLVSFIAGWALLLDYIVTIAISAYSVGPYLSFFFPALKIVWIKLLFAIVVIFVMVLINILGNKHSTRLSVVLMIFTTLTQLTIIVIGCVTIVSIPEFISHLAIGGTDKLWSPTWHEFFYGIVMAMVAYTGIESMAQLSSEAKEPKKTVPRAILLAMTLLLVMYAGIAITALSAISPQELSTTYKEDPISGIVAVLPVGKEILGPWVGGLAAIILVVAANAGLLGASRLSFNMGEYFQLPGTFYRLHSKLKTPYVALIIFGLLASVVVIWSKGVLDAFAELYSFGAMLAFSFANVSLVVHRFRYPNIERPFKAPLNITIKGKSLSVTAMVGALMTSAVWVFILFTKPAGRNLGLLWIVVGLLMYFVYRKQHKLSPVAKVELEKIKVTGLEDFEAKKILLLTRGHLSTDILAVVCGVAKKFDAELTVLHVVEIPYMLPISTSISQLDSLQDSVLKRAEAVGLEQGIKVDVRTIRARSVTQTVTDLIENEEFDLLVIENTVTQEIGSMIQKLVSQVKCRVWICRAQQP